MQGSARWNSTQHRNTNLGEGKQQRQVAMNSLSFQNPARGRKRERERERERKRNYQKHTTMHSYYEDNQKERDDEKKKQSKISTTHNIERLRFSEVTFHSLGSLDTLPCGCQLDENTLALDASFFVQLNEAARLCNGFLHIEGKPGYNTSKGQYPLRLRITHNVNNKCTKQ